MGDIPIAMIPAKLVDFFERADVASSSPSSASLRELRIQKNQEHLRYLWIGLGSVIGVLTVIHLVRFALEWLAPCSGAKPSGGLGMQDSEKSTGQTLRAPGIQRVCWALATGFRIVFFRWNIRVLPGFLLSFSEISFICGYITLNLALLFIDSELLLFITFSLANNFI